GQKIQRLDIGTPAEAEAFRRALESAAFTVANVEAKPAKRNPPPPFTTSTLQQEASRKLGFAPAHTMRIAQRLYEGVDVDGETIGLITYMRTDGVDVAEEALAAARRLIGADYGRDYLPPSPRQYQTKAKNAQEAHEAIRPTDAGRRPREMKSFLDHDQARLYELIWLRMVASQMESAELERTTADITATPTLPSPAGGGRDREGAHRSARHRHGGEIRRLPHALSGGRGRHRGRRRGPPSARDERRRKPHQAQDRCQPAFHRAAAALLGSVAGQAHGGAG